jgi:hypothetical protein
MIKAFAIVLMMLVLLGAAMTEEPSARAITVVHICELVKHPQRYDGKTVKVRARLEDHWEMGPRLSEGDCTKFVYFTYPDGPELPASVAKLRMNDDALTSDFRDKRRALCNGSDTMCDFSAVDANFIGVFVSKKRLSKYWDAPVLVATSVGQAKWTRNCDKSPPSEMNLQSVYTELAENQRLLPTLPSI